MLSTPEPDFSVKWLALGPIEINLANFGWYSHSILCDFYHLESKEMATSHSLSSMQCHDANKYTALNCS